MDNIIEQLRALGLSSQESLIYIELLKQPATHLQLSQITGINRTKVYRLIDGLEKRSLVTRRTDDRGTFLAAAEPAVLEAQIVMQEAELAKRRTAYGQVLPVLQELRQGSGKLFVVQTYRGIEGFRQMLWHELKAKGEMLVLGGGRIEDLVPIHQWCERHRTASSAAGYSVRELLNEAHWNTPFSHVGGFNAAYSQKSIPRSALTLDNQTVIYNHTVATYHWRRGEKVGVEIINKNYAVMMRQFFELYWNTV